MADERFRLSGKSFLQGFFCEADGTPSSSRLLSAVFGVASIVWVSLIVWAHIHHPYEPILPDLTGLAIFIGVPYGINKGSDMVVKGVSVFKTNINGQDNPK